MLLRGSAAALFAALLAIAAPAGAAPITYQYTSGQATITATAGSTTLAIQTLTLNGIFATFDEAALALTDFNFQTTPNQWLTLSQVYGGFDQVWVNSANVVPGAGYATVSASVLPGVGHYQVSVMPVVVNGVYTAKNSVTLATLGPVPISYTNATPLSADVDVLAGTFTLQGVTLGIVPVPGETNPVIVTANLTFQGAQQVPVPEPAGLALTALAAGALLLARRVRPLALGLALLLGLAASGASATTLTVIGNGLVAPNQNYGCPSGSANCLSSMDYALVAPAPATGTISVSGSIATLSLDVASVVFAPTSGPNLTFSNVHYSGTLNVFANASIVSQLGSATGLVSGLLDGSPFSSAALVTNLNCVIDPLPGQCSVMFGPSGFSAGGQDWLHTFTVQVAIPEPALALLALLGAAAVALRARR